jgi:hypothetical protein
VVGWKLRGDDYQPIPPPTNDPVSNAGFGPDYPFQKKIRRIK